MKCVAIPAKEEKLTGGRNLDNEITPKKKDDSRYYYLTTTPEQNTSNNITYNNSINKSLQRSTLSSCRSVEKDRRTSRGLASCLRGERDENAEYCQATQIPQAFSTSSLLLQTQKPRLSASRDEIRNVTALDLLDDRGRSECKSKTLPRIHFDASITDISLNEGNKRKQKKNESKN